MVRVSAFQLEQVSDDASNLAGFPFKLVLFTINLDADTGYSVDAVPLIAGSKVIDFVPKIFCHIIG